MVLVLLSVLSICLPIAHVDSVAIRLRSIARKWGICHTTFATKFSNTNENQQPYKCHVPLPLSGRIQSTGIEINCEGMKDRSTHDEGVKQATLHRAAEEVGHQEVSGLVPDDSLAVARHDEARQGLGHGAVQEHPVGEDKTWSCVVWCGVTT